MDKKFKSVVSTDMKNYYAVLFENGKLDSITFKTPGDSETRYFNPKDEWQQKITNDFLKEALTAMIGSNIAAFEMVYTAFEKKEHRDIAKEVFKQHWNNLYNTVVADDIFGREVSFGSICKVFDFFEEHK